MIKYVWILLLFTSLTVKAQISDFEGVDFHRADSVALSYKNESVKDLPLLSYHLTNSLPSEIEKFRAIYIWVCTNIENDYWGYVKNKQKRTQFRNDSLALQKWNAEFMHKVTEKLVKERKTLCTGYAYLIRELANLANIDCEIVDGYGKTATTNLDKKNSIPNHSWNAVKLNGKWYLCDATWASGFFNVDENKFIKEYSEGYFLSSPKLFIQSHYPLESKWMLLNKTPSLSEFLNAPLPYKHAFEQGLIYLKPSTMKIEVTKNESIVLLFETFDSTNVNDLKLEISSDFGKNTVKPIIKKLKDGQIELHHTFKSTGSYDLHLKLGNQYLFSYTVKVKRNKK